ncbi:MAG: GGDEF domain-containing protein [Pirellulales bacterium]|nr:GGDEF domain-containing protein [Pirellulales bacterium]
MDLSGFHISWPLALAAVATIGYLLGRKNRPDANDAVRRSLLELKRAQSVALELEKITLTVRKSLSQHHSSVNKFKERVNRMSDLHQEIAWKELCREADEILKPTLQLAAQIAGAYDEIRQQSAKLMSFTEARTDSLTGIKNRRGLDDALHAQITLLARYEIPFAAAIFDIDKFKQVNDLHGHLHGDRVLQNLAKLMAENIRETDILARYGGEEFVVLMPETDLAGAGIFCERLREKVQQELKITISGGLAAASFEDNRESLFARADAALYEAKTAGRNRIYAHTGKESVPVEQESLQYS